MLRQHVPAIEAWLQDFDAAIGVNGQKLLPTPASYLVPALTIGIAARIFRLHGRISDWLGLRECFDVEVIIGEFGRQLSATASALNALIIQHQNSSEPACEPHNAVTR